MQSISAMIIGVDVDNVRLGFFSGMQCYDWRKQHGNDHYNIIFHKMMV